MFKNDHKKYHLRIKLTVVSTGMAQHIEHIIGEKIK